LQRATLIHEGRMTPYSNDGELDALHLLRLPLPHDELLALGAATASLTITLSYVVEPHETRSTRYAGAWLQWDLQRQNEPVADFLARINDADRDPNAHRTLPRPGRGRSARKFGAVAASRAIASRSKPRPVPGTCS
jgi:hypothetical protein